MLLGPVFQTEMVTNARRGRYFVLRVLFAALLLFCLWTCYVSVSSWHGGEGRLSIRDAAELASGFFMTFAWLTMLMALIITPAIAAGSIATERERRTIEYLFATDLSNTEIVLSKLFGKLLLVGKLIVVALPVLAIFRMMGGIPGSLLLSFFAMLASTVTLITVGAMCISVWTPRARDALMRVYLVEAIVFLLPFFVGAWLGSLGRSTGFLGWLTSWLATAVDWSLAINPLPMMFGQMLLGGGLGVGYGGNELWKLVATQLGVSLGLAVVAVAAVRRVHLRSISSSGGTGRKRRWQFPKFRPALRRHPMVWKELFARTAATRLGFLGRICVALIMISMMALAFYQYFEVINSWNRGWGGRNLGSRYVEVSVTITVLVGVGAVLLMGIRAAGLVTYEKERDCWLSLVSTPLTGYEIITAKALGNFYAFRWLILPLAIVWFLQFTLSPEFLLAIPFHAISIATTGLFATAVGLAYSMKFSTSLKAIGSTVGTLFFVGGGFMLCCCTPLAITGGGDEDIFKIALIACIPFLHFVPGLIAVEQILGSNEEWFVADYILGIFLYGGAGLAILGTLQHRFDSIVGRTDLPDVATAIDPTRLPKPASSIEPPTENAP